MNRPLMNQQSRVQWRLTGFAALATILTSLALLPTVADGGWGDQVFLAVMAVAVAGGTARQLGLPRVLVPVAQLVALSVFLSVTFGGGVAVAGTLPGPGVARHFVELLRSGLSVTWNEAPPVSATDGVAFIMVAGVALVAVVVDATAVTWRRPTLAGLPLLVLYLVPAAVLPDGVPWPLFVLAGLGWVLLQLAEGRDRLARWGRLLGTRSEPTSGIHAVGGTGRRLGATALAVAVIIPIVLPSLDDGVFGGGGSTGEGPGSGGGRADGLKRVATINPLVDIRRNLTRGADQVVLRYRTNDDTPQYLRIATLDRFDGTAWKLEEMEAAADQQAADGLPSPPGLQDEVARTTVTTEVQVLALDTPRLPLPYPVSRVDIEGDWRWDADTYDVFSAEDGGNALGTTYSAVSLDIAPTPTQLETAPAPGEPMERFLGLPDSVRQALETPTAQVIADAPTRYDQALAIQNWFRENFEYSLETPAGNGTNDLESFLADRSGYCEQFSATMALMARAAGIPSRVQVGFTPGEQLADGTWEVTTHDAHAWPELWFERTGWVRFEPTPGGGDGNATPGWAPPPVATNVPGGGPGGRDPSGDGKSKGAGELRKVPDDKRLPTDPDSSRSAPGQTALDTRAPASGSRWAPYLLLLLVIGAVTALAPAVARFVERRRRWRSVTDEASAIQAAWADVMSTAADVDLAPKATETTRDLANRLPKQGGLSRATAARLADLAQALELARYSGNGHPRDLPDQGAAMSNRNDAWRTVAEDVCGALMAAVSRRDRRRAIWWPASGRAQLATMWGGLNQRMESWWPTVTRRLASRFRRA